MINIKYHIQQMSIHAKALKKACENLEISHTKIDFSGTFVEVVVNNEKYHFVANYLPLNSASVIRICKDKEHTFSLLKNVINMPNTSGYLDPEGPEPFVNYAQQSSVEEIVEDMAANFEFPFIVKMNKGSQGKNVYRVENKEHVIDAVKQIFKDGKDYDYVALAQENVEIKREYRVVVLFGEIQFVYLKDNSEGNFVGNLSPLHWVGARAQLIINNDQLTIQIKRFIKPIFEKLNLEFGGLDIAVDKEGKFWLLEINTTIGLDYFVGDNGMDRVVKLYEKILLDLKKR